MARRARPAYFYNEKLMCGLGKGLAETGRLNPEGRRRALVALKRFSLLAKGMGIETLTVVATAAAREASDGPAFQAEVLAQTGLKIWVVDGDEEARLSAQGVLLGWPDAKGIVCDIGGNSMELAKIGGGTVGQRVSTPLGPFRLATGRRHPEKARRAYRPDFERLSGTAEFGRRADLSGGRIVAGDRAAGYGAARLSADSFARISYDAQ